MRRKWFGLFVSFVFLFLLLVSFNADRGVRFKKYSWNDMGRNARAYNKMIFVYVTAKYCPTGKKTLKILSDKKVSEFYNKNFVSTTFDAENLGQYFRASNWGVSAIPAFVFLDKNREIIHKFEGALDAKGMLQEAETAIENNKEKLKKTEAASK